MRIARLTLRLGIAVACFLSTGVATVKAQSIEETYDATLAAYNQTLNQLEECDLAFENFQKFFKESRPRDDASKEEWDGWARQYRFWVDVFTNCMRELRKRADALKAKLDELEKQLDAISAEPDTKAQDDKKKKAPGLLKKGRNDLEKWTLNVRYKIRQVNDWSREASEEVKEHGSGAVKIEPRYEFKF